tara:strand:- start:3941 stop:4363 length:423 start_codon:yes stop_codon:yes gene_type:complete
MYKTYLNIKYLKLIMLGFLLSTLILSLNNILPPINNIYYTSVHVPIAGKQNIMYERLSKYQSEIKLTGTVTVNGYVFFDKKNPYKYEVDDNLKNVLKKYKCTLYEPNYDSEEDIITLKIKINLIRYTKRLILKNINCYNK